MRTGELVLWVTTDCNLRCRYCYANGGENPEYMDWQVAKRALDLMLNYFDSFKVQFAGGEPLLNMDLIERVVNYTGGLSIRYQIQTNATLIDRGVARWIRELGISVGVSLDGLPEVNDFLRPFADGRGSTTATISGLESLRAEGIRVGLTCVLSAENVAGLPGLVELASYLGNVEGISLDLLRPMGRAKRGEVDPADPALAARSVNAALRRAEELSLMGGRRVKFREVERIRYLLSHGLERKYRCPFDARRYLVVDPKGRAWPCPSLVGIPEFYLGNILEDDFADELSDKLERCRGLIALPRYCSVCPERRLCGGPCLAQTYAGQLSGEVNLTECYVRRAFINFARGKEVANHAAKEVCLSV